MSESIDMLVSNARQILVMPRQNDGPQRGEFMGTLGLIEAGAVAIHQGQIVAVGKQAALNAAYQAETIIDAQNGAIVPGFVDPHTHAVWTADRAHEFEMRIAGASYMEIMNAGGGINSTVKQVRAATRDDIIEQTRPRLDRMLAHGSTTIEVKTGYGLDTENEIKLLDAIYQLDADHPADLVPTFLGAHSVPAEYEGRTDAYVDLIVDEMIPAVAEFAQSRNQPQPFIDVFCEDGVFDVPQSRRILEAGAAVRMPLKIHADEFVGLGGTGLAVELGAASADHLVSTPDADIAALGSGTTVAVGLPGTPFGLAHHDYTPARRMLDAGAALAIATDCNPGTAWLESMQFVMALAARYMKLTPAEALAAATINAAFAVGRGDRIGSLEVGKQADLLILDVPDYRHLAYRFAGNLVRTVIKSGTVVV